MRSNITLHGNNSQGMQLNGESSTYTYGGFGSGRGSTSLRGCGSASLRGCGSVSWAPLASVNETTDGKNKKQLNHLNIQTLTE